MRLYHHIIVITLNYIVELKVRCLKSEYLNVNFLLFPVEIYLSPVETHCMNVDYFIPDENNETKGLSDDAMNR